MPRLPRFQGQSIQQGGFSQTESLFVGGGRGVNLGGLARGLDALRGFFQKRVEEDSKRRGIEANLDAELSLTQKLSEDQETFDFRTQDFGEHTLQTAQSVYQPFIDSAKTSTEKQYLENKLKQTQITRFAGAVRFQNAKFAQAVKLDSEEFVDKATKHIIANPSREVLSEQIDNYLTYVETFERLKNTDQKGALQDFGAEKFTVAYVDSLIDADIDTAMKELEDPDIQGFLSAKSLATLKKSAETKQKEDQRFNFSVMQAGLDDYLVRLQLGEETDEVYEKEYTRLATELKNPRALEALDEGKKVAVAARPLQEMLRAGQSIQEMEKFVESKNPENFADTADSADVQVHDGLVKILNSVKTGMQKDMMAFELGSNRILQGVCKDGDSERCILEKHNALSARGIPETQHKYLTNQEAKGLAEQFVGLPFDEVEGRMDQLRRQYGTVELANGLTAWDKVLGQLTEEGLPKNLEFFAAKAGAPDLNLAFEANSYTPEELKTLKDQFAKDERDAVMSTITDETADFFAGIGQGGVQSANLRELIFKHAMNLVNHGQASNLNQAAEFAMDFWVNSEYTVSTQPNGTGSFVVPKTFNGADVDEELVKLNIRDFYLNRRSFSSMRGTPSDFQTLQAPVDNFNSRLISSRYGARKSPKDGASKFHSGLDIAVPLGTPIRSTQSGTVVEVTPDNGNAGNTVVVDHGNGLRSRYFHMNDFNVGVGDQVEAGQTLGSVGSTGNVTGPHLHFEVQRQKMVTDSRGRRQVWQSVDPEAFINKRVEGISFGDSGLGDGYQEDEIWNTVEHLGKLQLAPDGSGYFVMVPRKENSLSGSTITTPISVWSYKTGKPMFIPMGELMKQVSSMKRAFSKAEAIEAQPEVPVQGGFVGAKIGRPLR